MGEAFHCIIAAGSELLRVYTHPFTPVPVGERVTLQLTLDSCGGLPASAAPAGTGEFDLPLMNTIRRFPGAYD